MEENYLNIALATGIILLAMCFSFIFTFIFMQLILSYKQVLPSQKIQDKDSIFMRMRIQPHVFSRENRLHLRQRISHILNAKVEWFKPCPYRIKGLVRFKLNAATSIYDSKSYRHFNLVKEYIEKW